MAAAILLFCFQGAGRKLSTECRSVAGSRPSWRPIAGRALKRPGDLVQMERRNEALRGFVHQVRAGRLLKRPGDLVQRGRKNKVLRGFVHQVRAGRALKRSGDLVQRERKNKGLRGFVHQVGTGRASTPGRKIGKRGPDTGRVGAPLPAKPCVSVTRRQHFALERCRPPAELAPHCRQSLVPPLRGANILPWSAAGHRPSWRPFARKALCLRCEAPTFCSGAQSAAGKVRARLPAKPINSVFVREPRCREEQKAGPPAGTCSSSAGRQKTIKKRATSVARPWCAIRGSNPGHPD